MERLDVRDVCVCERDAREDCRFVERLDVRDVCVCVRVW